MAGDFVWMGAVSLLFYFVSFFYIWFHYIASNKLYSMIMENCIFPFNKSSFWKKLFFSFDDNANDIFFLSVNHFFRKKKCDYVKL